MKKQSLFSLGRLILVVLFLLTGINRIYASDEIAFVVGYDNPVPGTAGHGKSPILFPTVLQDDYELCFQSSHPFYTLYVMEEDVVVFSVVVPSSTTSVVLPSWLSGEYELQLHMNDCSYYFFGYISL